MACNWPGEAQPDTPRRMWRVTPLVFLADTFTSFQHSVASELIGVAWNGASDLVHVRGGGPAKERRRKGAAGAEETAKRSAAESQSVGQKRNASKNGASTQP